MARVGVIAKAVKKCSMNLLYVVYPVHARWPALPVAASGLIQVVVGSWLLQHLGLPPTLEYAVVGPNQTKNQLNSTN